MRYVLPLALVSLLFASSALSQNANEASDAGQPPAAGLPAENPASLPPGLADGFDALQNIYADAEKRFHTDLAKIINEIKTVAQARQFFQDKIALMRRTADIFSESGDLVRALSELEQQAQELSVEWKASANPRLQERAPEADQRAAQFRKFQKEAADIRADIERQIDAIADQEDLVVADIQLRAFQRAAEAAKTTLDEARRLIMTTSQYRQQVERAAIGGAPQY